MFRYIFVIRIFNISLNIPKTRLTKNFDPLSTVSHYAIVLVLQYTLRASCILGCNGDDASRQFDIMRDSRRDSQICFEIVRDRARYIRATSSGWVNKQSIYYSITSDNQVSITIQGPSAAWAVATTTSCLDRLTTDGAWEIKASLYTTIATHHHHIHHHHHHLYHQPRPPLHLPT